MWMAGGGLKPGITYGVTDEFGYHVSEDVVHVRALHATILNLLGIDHHQFKFKFKATKKRRDSRHNPFHHQ